MTRGDPSGERRQGQSEESAGQGVAGGKPAAGSRAGGGSSTSGEEGESGTDAQAERRRPDAEGAASTGSRPSGASAAGGARSHVVRSGESLWLIAEQLLGDGASNARIAAEVAHLWERNADRIGSGDPDLIYPGQELRL